jgi:hypothetical protein
MNPVEIKTKNLPNPIISYLLKVKRRFFTSPRLKTAIYFDPFLNISLAASLPEDQYAFPVILT